MYKLRAVLNKSTVIYLLNNPYNLSKVINDFRNRGACESVLVTEVNTDNVVTEFNKSVASVANNA